MLKLTKVKGTTKTSVIHSHHFHFFISNNQTSTPKNTKTKEILHNYPLIVVHKCMNRTNEAFRLIKSIKFC